MVEENVVRAERAVDKRDDDLARKVIDMDKAIDIFEQDVEENCLKVLALHQPVATDLRFIIAILKINHDIERIGNLAVKIAHRSLEMKQRPDFVFSSNFPEIIQSVQLMVKKAIDALIDMNSAMAREVGASDEVVDTLYKEMSEKVTNGIRQAPDKVEDYLQLLSIMRHLERIADHAKNIADYVVYMIEGTLLRH